MKRPAIVLLSLLFGGGIVWWAARAWQPEPVYEQKTARAWIRELGSDDYESQRQAEQAIQVLGPASVPYLIARFREHPTLFTQLRADLSRRLPLPAPEPLPSLSLRQNIVKQLGIL